MSLSYQYLQLVAELQPIIRRMKESDAIRRNNSTTLVGSSPDSPRIAIEPMESAPAEPYGIPMWWGPEGEL